MGQKVNPHGIRVGVIKDWDSRWFASKKDFSDNLVEDHKIRTELKAQLKDAGVPKIEIERTVDPSTSAPRVTVNIYCAKPGMVIGKGGEERVALQNKLTKEYGKTVIGIQSFVAFYQVNTQTQTSTQLVFPYRFTQDLTYGYGDVAFPADTRSVRPMVRRIGKNVQVQGVLSNKYTVNNGQSNLVMRTLPAGCRPMGRLYGTTPSAGGVYEVDIDTNGNILLTNFTGRAIKPGSFISITFSFMAA